MTILPGPNVFMLYNLIRCSDHWRAWKGAESLAKILETEKQGNNVLVEGEAAVRKVLDEFRVDDWISKSENGKEEATIPKRRQNWTGQLEVFEKTLPNFEKELKRAVTQMKLVASKLAGPN